MPNEDRGGENMYRKTKFIPSNLKTNPCISFENATNYKFLLKLLTNKDCIEEAQLLKENLKTTNYIV